MDMTDRNKNDAIPSEFLARTKHWNGDITICSEETLSHQTWKTEYTNKFSHMHVCICERCSSYCAYTPSSDTLILTVLSSHPVWYSRKEEAAACTVTVHIYHLSRVFIWIERAEAVHALLCAILWFEASVLALVLTASHFAQSGERWRIECLCVWLLSIINIIIVLITHSCLFFFTLVSFYNVRCVPLNLAMGIEDV